MNKSVAILGIVIPALLVGIALVLESLRDYHTMSELQGMDFTVVLICAGISMLLSLLILAISRSIK